MSGIQVEVVYALPSRCWRFPVELPEGATVADALAAADPARHIPGLELDPQRLAVFGRPVTPESVLHPGDRVEILRPLLADPKLARRRRAGQA